MKDEITEKKGKSKMLFLQEREETPVFFTGVLYAQTPISLLKDKEVKLQGKGIWAVYHAVCRNKILEEMPFTFISQKRIAEEWLGISRTMVYEWTKHLQEKGWLTLIRQGLGHPNIIVLHDRKDKRVSERARKKYLKIVREYYKKFDVGYFLQS